jgi:hypothetical protein
VLELHLLGRPGATFGGRPLALSLRQIELLAALAIHGPARSSSCRPVYGERPVSPTTINKRVFSHLAPSAARRRHGPVLPYRLPSRSADVLSTSVAFGLAAPILASAAVAPTAVRSHPPSARLVPHRPALRARHVGA